MSHSKVKCPTCRRQMNWDDAPFRPFCSERCRLSDLGAWLTEQRTIPGESTIVPDDENSNELHEDPR